MIVHKGCVNRELQHHFTAIGVLIISTVSIGAIAIIVAVLITWKLKRKSSGESYVTAYISFLLNFL